MPHKETLDISWSTIFKIFISFLIIYLLFLIKDILIWFIFALIISVLFNPAIDYLEKKKVPRIVGTILIYVFLFSIFGVLIYSVIPPLISEIQQFLNSAGLYFEKIAPPLRGLGFEVFENLETFIITLQNWLIKASGSIINAIVSVFGGIFSTINIFILAIFLSLEKGWEEKTIKLFLPKEAEDKAVEIWKKSQSKVSGWFGTRVLTCIAVGLMTFLVCYFLNINYAVSFGIFAGILDIIPIIGPIIAGAVIIIFSALDSFGKAIIILIVFILIQQIEGNILTPLLSKKFVGLPPALVLLSLMVGGALFGILGAILAIPIAGILFEFLKNFLEKRKEEVTES